MLSFLQNVVYHYHHKTLMLQHILLLKQADVDHVEIHPHEVNCMEHNWHPNATTLK